MGSDADPRKIVLTGASRGLGKAMAAGFIERGHMVYGCSRSDDAIGELRETWAAPHDFQQVDVADDAQVAG